jgi:hypothetical protein
MRVTPQVLAVPWVNHRQIGIVHRSLPIVLGNAVLFDLAVRNYSSRLAAGKNDVPAVVTVSGQQKNPICRLLVMNYLKSPPFSELSYAAFPTASTPVWLSK